MMKIIYGITFLVLPLFVAGQLDGSGQGYGGSGQGKDPSGILGPDYEGSEEAYVSFKFTSRFAIVTMFFYPCLLNYLLNTGHYTHSRSGH